MDSHVMLALVAMLAPAFLTLGKMAASSAKRPKRLTFKVGGQEVHLALDAKPAEARQIVLMSSTTRESREASGRGSRSPRRAQASR
jgi:hypothetical protein